MSSLSAHNKFLPIVLIMRALFFFSGETDWNIFNASHEDGLAFKREEGIGKRGEGIGMPYNQEAKPHNAFTLWQ